MGLTASGLVATQALAAAAETPKTGGSIRVAGYSSGTTDTVDPARQSLSTDYVRCNMFYNGLTALDANLTPQPVLAESFESADARVWTLKLRKGVEFHDGATMTADDVVYSLTRLQDPKIGSPARPLATQMTEIKAMGPQEVRITLATPNADLPVALGTFHFKIIKNGTTNFTTANGTGAYKCKEFAPGVRSVGVRNPHYWKAGKPYLDQIEFFGIADDAARVNALLAGDIQLAGGINPRATRQVKAAHGYDVFETRSGGYTDLIARLDVAQTGNADFVMALKYLMDREQMKRAIFQNYAVVGNDQPIDPTNRFYNPHLAQRPFDPERAKFHLKKSGIGATAVPLVASTAASSSVDMAVLMQGAARKIGLNLDIKQVPAGGYWSNYWLKAPLCFGNINPRPSADILLTLFFKSDAPWNESKWKDAKFDSLLLAARSELDLAKRKAMYWDMQGMIRDDAGIGIPLFLSNLDAHSARLKGLRPIPTGGMMGFDFAENVWLA
ncbi:MAG: ABC transporter substrate-binding protein [Rhodospirillales bacterium]|nr:ABC transporter substrate-binding protein [Rhodospirillales bacterium]MDE2575175.1 ABC transporter substrate-binding protein [Rhodospirillales bacterium]